MAKEHNGEDGYRCDVCGEYECLSGLWRFSQEICRDTTERNHRFLEEALELVQSTGCSRSEAHQLVDYVFDRPIGEPFQEVGGVCITFAGLCSCLDIDQETAGEAELAHISRPETMERIRQKQAAKPKHSPLPA